jgi:hypothetical protein
VTAHCSRTSFLARRQRIDLLHCHADRVLGRLQHRVEHLIPDDAAAEHAAFRPVLDRLGEEPHLD